MPHPAVADARALVQSAVLTCLPREIPASRPAGPLLVYLKACLDLFDAALMLLDSENFHSAKVVARALVDAYGRLAWITQDIGNGQQIQARLLSLDAESLRQHRRALTEARSSGVPVPHTEEAALASRENVLQAEQRALGLSSIPAFPNARNSSTAGGPKLYFSFMHLSASTHLSSGVIGDVLDLEQQGGPSRSMHVAVVLESCVQAILHLLERVVPAIDPGRSVGTAVAHARGQFAAVFGPLIGSLRPR